ncbi:MAG TPA: hypothetical protein PK402_02740, partial [Tepidisphaeraceae bacterium]|nr:hypothetical protein [Tepidisphaeraceae bacterium]
MEPSAEPTSQRVDPDLPIWLALPVLIGLIFLLYAAPIYLQRVTNPWLGAVVAIFVPIVWVRVVPPGPGIFQGVFCLLGLFFSSVKLALQFGERFTAGD